MRSPSLAFSASPTATAVQHNPFRIFYPFLIQFPGSSRDTHRPRYILHCIEFASHPHFLMIKMRSCPHAFYYNFCRCVDQNELYTKTQYYEYQYFVFDNIVRPVRILFRLKYFKTANLCHYHFISTLLFPTGLASNLVT